MEIKLKSCPFCGSEDIYPFVQKNPEIFCNTCKAIFAVEDDSPYLNCDEDFKYRLEKTAEAWNKRAEQRWIPCSKRLPPELKPVNVTWINRQPPTYYENLKDKPFTDTAVIYEGKWYWQSAVCVDLLKEYGESPADDVEDAIDIVAWMPLPEPYEEVNE